MKNNLVFKDTTLNIIDNFGERWIPLSDLAKALYPYKSAIKRGCQIDTPFESRVRKIYSRHKDEFSSNMTKLIDIQTEGGTQKVRVFSLRGAHLVGMLARTERAKEFRRWILDIIEKHNNERGILWTEYHKELALIEAQKGLASIHGKGLCEWKKQKKRGEETIKALENQIQPSLLMA